MAENNKIEYGPVLRVADLDTSRGRDITARPDETALAELAKTLGLAGLRKVTLTGRLAPLGKRDWQFSGVIGATVTQESVVTLDPVTTRIDDPVERRWLAGWEAPTAEESEAPEDVDADPLEAEIDFGAVLAEALALALPDFPRAPDDALEEQVFTEPGKAPMRDEDTKPFAGLAALKAKLDGDAED